MPKEFYPSITCEETPRRQTETKVTILLRSQAPNSEEYSEEELQQLNSTAVIAGEAARTCYSQKLQTPEDYIKKSDNYRAKTDEIVTSTKESGHLTTRQHVSYTFALEGISRHAVHFLHSQPHYNSEEVSQRYTNLKDTSPILPDLGSESLDDIARNISEQQIADYNELCNLLFPTAKAEILKRFPGRNNPKWEKQTNDDASKKAQEVARYLLPLGTPTNLYFTISELTLIRLNHLKNTLPAQPEIASLIDAMTNTVAQIDPSILDEVSLSVEAVTGTEISQGDEEAPAKTTHRNPRYSAGTRAWDFASFETVRSFNKEFDDLIQNKEIKIDSINANVGETLARSVRLVLGQDKLSLPDSDALTLLLDPKTNKLLTSVYGEIVMDHLSQCLNQVNISAIVSLSHTANYQLNRHRGFHHTTPLLLNIPDLQRDTIVPNLLNENPEALAFYLHSINTHINKLHNLEDLGVSPENLQYLLPNATRIRKSISGPLGAFYHFIKSRTCLTAQEEIYSIAVSLAKQITETSPELAPYFRRPAPCGVRSNGGIKPQCPEGKRFCGVRVWDLTVDQYPKRTI